MRAAKITFGLVGVLLLNTAFPQDVRLPITASPANPMNSLTADFIVGGQAIPLTVGTNAVAVLIGSVAYIKNGYDQSKSDTDRPGKHTVGQFTLPNAYLAGVNDRVFIGGTIDDYICPADQIPVCDAANDGVEMFVIQQQKSGDQMSSIGRIGLDYDKNSVLLSYSKYLAV